MLVAEDGGNEFGGLTSNQGAAIVRANLESTATRYELLSDKP